MKTVSVELGERSYNIFVGPGLLKQSEVFDGLDTNGKPLVGNQVVVATNRAVAQLYLQDLRTSLGSRDVRVFEFDEGETQKTLTSVSRLIDFMVDVPCDRSVTVVALGGALLAIWRVSPLPVISEAHATFRSPPPCSPRSTLRLAEKLQ